jgi:acetate kinase
MSGTNYILCLNCGSSSLKYSLYRMGEGDEKLLAQGSAERIGLDRGRAWFRTGSGAAKLESSQDFSTHREAIESAFERLMERRLAMPSAVGHRIVHGGPAHFRPATVNRELVAELKDLIAYAPLHLPAQILGIEAVAERFPQLPQIACFDTAFHHRMPERARRFPLPGRFWEEGLRRYGFHGLSYEYILDALRPDADARIIVAHLGNGASMAAVRGGNPMDTTMGFTPTGGIMMGTRSGDLDPGVLLHLLNVKGYSGVELERLLNDQAGLLGVSGSSPDMRTLLSLRDRDPGAALAIDMFCYQACKCIGSLAAALGGLDTLVFTGGIGEKAAPVRSAICRNLAHIGIVLDESRNEDHRDPTSATRSRCTVRIIPTHEDLMIARHTHRLVSGVMDPV